MAPTKDAETPTKDVESATKESTKKPLKLHEQALLLIAKFGVFSALAYVLSLLVVSIGLIGTAATFGNGLSDGQYIVLKPASESEDLGVFRTYRLVEKDYKRWDVDIGAVDIGRADVASGYADASVQEGVDAGRETQLLVNVTLQNAFTKGTGVKTNEGDVYAYAEDEVAEFENFKGKFAMMVLAFIILKTFAACDFLQKVAELFLSNMFQDGIKVATDFSDEELQVLEAFQVWRVKDLIISSQFMGPVACAAVGGILDFCQSLACSWLPNVYVFPLSSIRPDENFINLASFDFDDDRLFYICAGFAYFVVAATTIAAVDRIVVCKQRRNGEDAREYTSYHLESGGCLLNRCVQDAEQRKTDSKRVWPLLVLRLMLSILRLSVVACLVAVVACFVFYLQVGFKMVIAFDFSLYGSLSIRYNLVAWACVLRFLLPVIILVEFVLLCGKFAYALFLILRFLWAYLPCSAEQPDEVVGGSRDVRAPPSGEGGFY